MNEGVFFVVSPISWEGSFSIISVIITFFLSFGIYWWIFYGRFGFTKKTQKKVVTQKKDTKKYILPHFEDTHFAEKIFVVLQEFVRAKYIPHNAVAHTKNDIISYCNNSQILKIWGELENILYKGEQISQKQKEYFLQTIKTIISLV